MSIKRKFQLSVMLFAISHSAIFAGKYAGNLSIGEELNDEVHLFEKLSFINREFEYILRKEYEGFSKITTRLIKKEERKVRRRNSLKQQQVLN